MVSLEYFLLPKIKEVLKKLMGVKGVEEGTEVAWKGLFGTPNLNIKKIRTIVGYNPFNEIGIQDTCVPVMNR